MNKTKIIKICNTVAFILALSFVLKIIRDVSIYLTTPDAVPLSLWVIVDAARYLMPAAFLFLIGRLMAYWNKKEEQAEKNDKM